MKKTEIIEATDTAVKLFDTVQKLIPLSQACLFVAGVSGLYFKAEWMARNWRLCLFIALAYQLLIALLSLGQWLFKFSGEVLAEFEKDAFVATVAWIRAIPGKFAPGFRHRYCHRVMLEEGVLNLRGLITQAAHTPELDRVFIDLKISTTASLNDLSPDPIAAKKLANARTIWDFVRTRKSKSGEAIALAIIGPPGSGKSTLMQHVAYTLATNRQRRYRVSAYTPILMRLRNHAATILDNPNIALGDLLYQHFSGTDYEELRTPRGWFENRLKNGKCLVMLDGLDEVADFQGRQCVSTWAERQIKKYYRCQFVITSRPHGYRDARLNRATVVEVQLFNTDQVNRFIRAWYLEHETVKNGRVLDEGVKLRAKHEANKLIARMRRPQSRGIKSLTTNPLLLTMIAMVHCYRGQLPESRVELYREICEVLLGRWRQVAGIPERLSADQKRDVLMPLAEQMMKKRVIVIEAGVVTRITKKPLSQMGVREDEVLRFLFDLQESSGLMLEHSPGQWGFAHKTFQEYLTATHWLVEKIKLDWNALVTDSWWHETLCLYAAQGDATRIVQACLNNADVMALTLAVEIIEEGPRRINQKLRDAVYERVDNALDSTDPDLRKFAAEVKLSRRLNSLHPLDHQSMTSIDSEHLTCAEYQLFLNEMLMQQIFHQPDHWTDTQFPFGTARLPICGMRDEDASAFCNWLTQRERGNALYRLPTMIEARQTMVPEAELGCWCHDDNVLYVMLADLHQQRVEQALSKMADIGLPHPSMLSFACARTLGRARNLDLTRLLNLAFGPESSLGRSRDLARTLNLVIDNIINRFPNNAEVLSEGSTRNFKLEIHRVPNSSLASDHDFAPARDVARDIASDLNSEINRDPDSSLARARDLTRDLTRDLDRDLDDVLSLAHSPAHGYLRELIDVLSAHNVNSRYLRIVTLIRNLLVLASATVGSELKRAERQFASHVFECATLALFKQQAGNKFPWWRRWWKLRKVAYPDMKKYENEQEFFMQMSWWLKIVIARENGLLPAWEGIRIVQENKKEEDWFDEASDFSQLPRHEVIGYVQALSSNDPKDYRR